MFRYKTGEMVKEGDLIRYRSTEWKNGKIAEIVPQGTMAAYDLICHNGGVFIEIEWEEGKSTLTLDTTDDEVLSDECVFVARREKQEQPDGGQNARTAKPTTTEGFYYETGESVQKGDILLVFVGEWRSARVEKIIPPGGEFEDAHPCEEGAICLKIERGNDGTGAFPGIVVTSSDNILHEDYVFVRRLEEEK